MKVLFVNIILLGCVFGSLGTQVDFSVARPRAHKNDDGIYVDFVQNYADYSRLHKMVYFDACNSEISDEHILGEFRWIFEYVPPKPEPAVEVSTNTRAEIFKSGPLRTGAQVNTGASVNNPFRGTSVTGRKRRQTKSSQWKDQKSVFDFCDLTWYAPWEGDFKVTLQYIIDKKVVSYKYRTVMVRDIWIAALGDSVMSGQGNPEVAGSVLTLKQAEWLDAECYRSAKGSYGYLTFEDVAKTFKKEGILFTFIPCSDASVQEGILGKQYEKEPQFDVMEGIMSEAKKECKCSGCCKTVPDVVLLSIGANDIQFSSIASNLVKGDITDDINQAPLRLKRLDANLYRLDERVKKSGIPSKNIFHVEYFDPLRNEKGVIDANCIRVGTATTNDLKKVDQEIVKPLNSAIEKACKKYGWTFVKGAHRAFQKHGVCSENSYIRSISESLSMQGNINGAYHPNYAGQIRLADVVWASYLRTFLKERFPE